MSHTLQDTIQKSKQAEVNGGTNSATQDIKGNTIYEGKGAIRWISIPKRTEETGGKSTE